MTIKEDDIETVSDENTSVDPFSLLKLLIYHPNDYFISSESELVDYLKPDCLTEWIIKIYADHEIHTVSECKNCGIKILKDFMRAHLNGFELESERDSDAHFKKIIADFSFDFINSIRRIINNEPLEPIDVSFHHAKKIINDSDNLNVQGINDGSKINKWNDNRYSAAITINLCNNRLLSGDKDTIKLISEPIDNKLARNCNILNSNLNDVYFDNGELISCDFDNSTINNAIFKTAKLENSKITKNDFHHCDFSYSTFTGEEALCNGNTFHESNFDHANIKSTCFSGNHFANCSFIEISILSSSIMDSEFDNPDFKSAQLSDTSFIKCKLTNALFDDLNSSNASFEGSEIRKSSFNNANLSGANFNEAHIIGGSFVNANCRNAIFRDVIFEPEGFDDAVMMTGADLSGADLRGANIRYTNTEWRWYGEWTCDIRGAKYCLDERCKTLFPPGFAYYSNMIEVDIDGNVIEHP